MAVEPATGNMVVVGAMYGGTADFGHGVLTATPGGQDMILGLFTPSGACLWAFRYGIGGSEPPTQVTLELNPNQTIKSIFVVGSVIGTSNVYSGTDGTTPVNLGTPYTPITNPDIFVAKYTANGLPAWTQPKYFGHTPPSDPAYNQQGQEQGVTLIVDKNGDVIISGIFLDVLIYHPNNTISGGLDFGAGTQLGSYFGYPTPAIAKLSGTDGSYIAQRQISSQPVAFPIKLLYNATLDHVFLIGYIAPGQTDFSDGTGLVNYPNGVIYMLKMNNSNLGTITASKWNQNGNRVSDASMDSSGNVYISGYGQGTGTDFGSGSPVGAGVGTNQDRGWVVKIIGETGAYGGVQYPVIQQLEGPVTVGSQMIAVSAGPSGNVLMAGTYKGNMMYGNVILDGTPAGSVADTVFVAEWAGNQLKFLTQFNTTEAFGTIQSYDVKLTSSGAYVIGVFAAAGSYNFSGLSKTSVSSQDGFFVRLNP